MNVWKYLLCMHAAMLYGWNRKLLISEKEKKSHSKLWFDLQTFWEKKTTTTKYQSIKNNGQTKQNKETRTKHNANCLSLDFDTRKWSSVSFCQVPQDGTTFKWMCKRQAERERRKRVIYREGERGNERGEWLSEWVSERERGWERERRWKSEREGEWGEWVSMREMGKRKRKVRVICC